MTTATITSKGQITLPKEVREKMHLRTGDKINFRIDDLTGTATMVPLDKSVQDVFGVLQNLPRKTAKLSVEQMDHALAVRFSGKKR